MKTIELTRGKVAIVDDEDYEMLMKWKWYAKYNRDTKSFYAARGGIDGNKKCISIAMHRVIMGARKGQQVDHGDHDTLNNQKFNLSLTDSSGNNKNTSRRADNTSGHCGVYWRNDYGKWRAQIMVNGKWIGLGHYDDWRDAIAARQAANKKYGFHPNHGRERIESHAV